MEKVSVVGLGKLGLPLATTIASRGFKIIGADINQAAVNSARTRKVSFYEPNLCELLRKTRKNLRAITDIDFAVKSSDITFIIVPTPSLTNGKFSTKVVQNVCRKVGKSLKSKKEYHLVVVVSTVMPQASTKEIIPVLETSSGKKCGQDFGYCYNPEFIALGSVISNLLNPDFLLIGEINEKAGQILEKFYQKFCVNKPEIKRMNIVNAEIAKIFLNSYITTKISFANQLAEICEKVPGGNVDDISAALGSDTRIGRKYLSGGLGFGGPCFPRDNRAVRKFCRDIKVTPKIPQVVDQINKDQVNRLFKKITAVIPKGTNIGIFGLSYKPNTAVVEESQGTILAGMLAKNYHVFVFDPQGMANAKMGLRNKVKYSQTLRKCFNDSELVIITTPWEVFTTELSDLIKRANKNITVIDCWRLFPNGFFPPNVKHWRLGVSAE